MTSRLLVALLRWRARQVAFAQAAHWAGASDDAAGNAAGSAAGDAAGNVGFVGYTGISSRADGDGHRARGEGMGEGRKGAAQLRLRAYLDLLCGTDAEAGLAEDLWGL